MESPKPFVVDREAVESFSPPHHEGTSSVELLAPGKGSDEVVFRISTVQPGGRDEWHAHAGSQQLLYVLGGRATLRLGVPGDDDETNAETHSLSPGSFAFVPRETYHQVSVPDDGEAFEVVVVWVPPYESFDEWDTGDA
jgi:quercetin dioxygenase-like cupin family protein